MSGGDKRCLTEDQFKWAPADKAERDQTVQPRDPQLSPLQVDGRTLNV